MARLQILELPEGTGDDRPPFILVVDQMPASEPEFDALRRDLVDNDIAARTGARAVLAFEETIDIPANQVPLDENGHPLFLKMHIEGDFEKLREQVQEETLYAQGKVTRALRATDQDRKASITDALGMDRLRDWDDIHNAAAGIRKQRDAQSEAIERVRNLHRPVEHGGITICVECSGWDGSTTDSSPCGYEHCPTLRALAADQPAADA